MHQSVDLPDGRTGVNRAASPAHSIRGLAERIDRRKLRYQHRHPELLAAATEYVLDHGFANVSMRRLAEGLGVSHSTLLHHFGTRDDLITEILEHVHGRIAEPREVSPEALAELWKEWCSPEGRREFRFMFETLGQALTSPGGYERFLEHVANDVLEVAARSFVAAGCPESDASRLATFLIAQIRGLQLDLLTTGDQARVDEAFALLVETINSEVASSQAGTK